MSGRQYARAVVDVLDPSGRLFGQRIIAQGLPGEALLDKSKRLMEGLEVLERLTGRCIAATDPAHAPLGLDVSSESRNTSMLQPYGVL